MKKALVRDREVIVAVYDDDEAAAQALADKRERGVGLYELYRMSPEAADAHTAGRKWLVHTPTEEAVLAIGHPHIIVVRTPTSAREDTVQRAVALLRSPILLAGVADRDRLLQAVREHKVTAAELLEFAIAKAR